MRQTVPSRFCEHAIAWRTVPSHLILIPAAVAKTGCTDAAKYSTARYVFYGSVYPRHLILFLLKDSESKSSSTSSSSSFSSSSSSVLCFSQTPPFLTALLPPHRRRSTPSRPPPSYNAETLPSPFLGRS